MQGPAAAVTVHPASGDRGPQRGQPSGPAPRFAPSLNEVNSLHGPGERDDRYNAPEGLTSRVATTTLVPPGCGARRHREQRR